jgi:hypothetical protein
VDQTLRVHSGERLRERHRDGDDLARTEPAAGREQPGQAATCRQVEHQHQRVAVAVHRAQPDDVRVVDSGQHRGLATQPVAGGQVGAGPQPLERDRKPGGALAGQPDLTAGPVAEQLDGVEAGQVHLGHDSEPAKDGSVRRPGCPQVRASP